MRCLVWPSQAADWPTWQRHHSWPDSADVDHVVSNGCDVVPVAHHLCRQDEWMSNYQWRMSFSRAEIVLVNSWMPVQQIIYHMLRCLMKTERLTDGADGTGSLSNYHVKTLMLWACELKPISWWIDDLNLIRICVELLHTLAVWLTDSRCQHYFINDCNLFNRFENSIHTQIAANRLMSITRQLFCEWFIIRYVYKCAELCPSNVSRLLQDCSAGMPYDGMHRAICVQNVVSAIVKWKLYMSPRLADLQLYVSQSDTMHFISRRSLTLQSCLCWMNQLAKTDQALRVSFTAAVFLHAAYKTTQNSLTDEMLDVLSTTCMQSNDVWRCLNARHSSVLSLHQAVVLMKIIANNSCSTVQLIEIELSKAYLFRVLKCKDSDSNSIYCLANVYLAVLYYTTGQYQMAIDLCSVVTRSHEHSQCSSHVVQGELLPSIDHQVDSSLGLAVFYQYIRTAAFSEEQSTRHINLFTTEQFAHYLLVKLLSVANCHQLPQTSLADEHQRYRQRFSALSKLFITDVIAFSFTKCTRHLSKDGLAMADENKSSTLHQLDTSKLLELLKQSQSVCS